MTQLEDLVLKGLSLTLILILFSRHSSAERILSHHSALVDLEEMMELMECSVQAASQDFQVLEALEAKEAKEANKLATKSLVSHLREIKINVQSILS